MKITPRNHGAALVITLAMIAMLTFLIVAFLSRSVANLQIESASTGTARADILARSASEVIISDFKSEIIAGSDKGTSASQIPVYSPKTPAASIPAVSRFAFTDKATFINLVKQSTGRFYPDADPYDSNVKPTIQTVTNISTDVVSANGRSVINKRWDNPASPQTPSGPLLLVSAADPNYTRFYSNTMLPHWVMMTRQGVPASQDWTGDWTKYAPDNPKAAIGRFAYNIYNVGGLMDVNAVGYEEDSISPMLGVLAPGQKGTPGLARLSYIPNMGISDADRVMNADKFVKAWRNSVSAKGTSGFSDADNYLAYLGFTRSYAAGGGTYDLTASPYFLLGPKTGFMKAAVGTGAADNHVLGRQDLIRLAIKTPASAPPYGLNINTLPYLTHFSREVNAPSWYPVKNASDPTLNGNDGTASNGSKPYAYSDNKDKASFPNRLVPNVRVSQAPNWRRLTGEAAVDGEPLVKYRFPLAWLALVQDAEPASPEWDLTPEGRAIVLALDARRIANGGQALPGASVNDQAANLVGTAFGLVWDKTNSRWNYTGASDSTDIQTQIKTVGDVSSENKREPNFFELLKAGILSGSLGNSSDYESMCVTAGDDASPDNQVIQIGANIIDQADPDSYPTRITFNYRKDNPGRIQMPKSAPDNGPAGTGVYKVFAGVEDLPYLNTILSTPYRIPTGEMNLNDGTFQAPMANVQNAQRDSMDAWMQFVMWKPQQQATSSVKPTDFRILYTGTDIHVYYQKDDSATTPFNGVDFSKLNNFTEPRLLSPDPDPKRPMLKYVTFKDTPADFRIPTLLGGMDKESAHNFNASQPEGNGKNPRGTAQLPRGMWVGELYRPEKNTAVAGYDKAPILAHTEFRCREDATLELQYQDAKNNWQTYQRFDRFGLGTGASNYGKRPLYGYADSPTDLRDEGAPGFAAPTGYRGLDIATLAMSPVDPRAQRFGLLGHWKEYSDKITASMVPAGTWKNYLKQGWAPKNFTPYSMYFGPSDVTSPPPNSRFSPSWVGTFDNPWQNRNYVNPIPDPTAFWVDNSGSSASYKDMDMVQRRGDGESPVDVRPMQLDVTSSPPSARARDLGRVINRPFRSVGELSYVFRDEPYKSLNLFHPNSADGALLDLFSVDEQPTVVAGKININTQIPEVLQAVIAGAAREELSTGNLINKDDALAIAKLIIHNETVRHGTDVAPIINQAEIANRLNDVMPALDKLKPDTTVKTRREVLGRALAGSTQTRTWNFLVDVIAQSGRFGPNASKPAQFVVEGEQRYWIHVAIDRYTGQVIDQQFEYVME